MVFSFGREGVVPNPEFPQAISKEKWNVILYPQYSKRIYIKRCIFLINRCSLNCHTGSFATNVDLFCLLHKTKTAADMTDGVRLLEKILGEELFEREVQVLLTDRGSEFSNADGMEKRDDGKLRTRVFYCDPMRSDQKGSLENNHEELRYILPKGTDMDASGLQSQKAMNLVVSHINSFPKALLKGKSSIACLRFYYPELYEAFEKYGISEIPAKEIVLQPELLKPFRTATYQNAER